MASSPVGGSGVGGNPVSVNRNRWVNHKVYARRSISKPNPSSQPQESQYPSKTLDSTAEDDSLPKSPPRPVSQDDVRNLNLTTRPVNDQEIWKNDTVPVLETPVSCQQMFQETTPIVDVDESLKQLPQRTVFSTSDDVSTSSLKFELDKNELSNTALTIPVNDSSIIPYSIRQPSPSPPTPPLISHDLTSQGQKLVTINTEGGSLVEIRNLKRNLEVDLEKVRFYYHKVKAYEIQLSTEVPTYPGYSRNSQPFRGGRRSDLTVSVGPNPIENYRSSDDAVEKQNVEVTMHPGYGSNSHLYHGGRRMDLNIAVGSSPMENYNMGCHSLEKRTPKANQYYQKSEFLLGNEKIPLHQPPTSNKKPKFNVNKKHGFFQHRDGRVMDQATLNQRAFRKCDVLLSKLMKHRHGWVFNEPVKVDEMGLFDYFIIIKNPMDLGTVKSRLSKNWYKSPMDFAEDVRLTFKNAMTYNVKGHDVHIMAEMLSGIFEKQWASIAAELTPPHSMSIMPSKKASHPPLDVLRIPIRTKSMIQHPVVPELTPKPLAYTPRLQRAPSMKKPKAKDLNKREMTQNEKEKLSVQLESLPNEKFPQVVAIIKKRNSSFIELDGAFEINIETIDTETLWELDRLVSNHKKSRSKYKRREEERANAIKRAEEMQKNTQQGVNQEPVVVEKMMENQADMQTVAVSPGGKEKKAESGSGSGFSSSSSGSSSDSDSGSSSSSFSSR
ncbi:putative Bromodomain-containing protein [Zostera marina]|uniref:Putative Bromodomain-containing protein n=1 Tax=Zostera marina TaxID=29655 RepID=A0A0K9PMA3_ZOSMR|nr:putative Bromodomain-containing protein [Zostera marina]